MPDNYQVWPEPPYVIEHGQSLHSALQVTQKGIRPRPRLHT